MKKERKQTVYMARPKKISLAKSEKEVNYEIDFFNWTFHQAKLLKKRAFSELDIENLIEEIESLGRSDRRALRSQVVRLLMHMLKQSYQPEGQGNSRSWAGSISNGCCSRAIRSGSR